MAGTRIEFDLIDGASLGLAEVIRRVEDPTPLMREIGEVLTESTQQRFEDQRAPDGSPWEPLNKTYAKSKRKQSSRGAGLILVLNGYLADNIRYQADAEGVDIGTDAVYGATQQLGDESRGIPARPFLGLSDEDEQTIEQLVADYLEDALP